MTGEKKIVIWCGNAPNQRALANKIAAKFTVCGIVIDDKKATKQPPLLKKIFIALQDRVFFKTISHAWSSLQQQYSQQYPSWPNVPVLHVDNINDEKGFEFTKALAPDLVMVSGTNLVRSKMLSVKPPVGIINLHTGLSPYIKGGPNCTNWCIATQQYNLIGNTIMWINEGIDSGNIISSETTTITNASNLFDVQWQVMEHAHTLYLSAVSYLFANTGPYISMSQKKIANGSLYLTRMWNYSAKKKLLKNLPDFLKKGTGSKDKSIITISIT